MSLPHPETGNASAASDLVLEPMSSDNSSAAPLTHHPSLLSAYESELQFEDSTFQHETEPYMYNVRPSRTCIT